MNIRKKIKNLIDWCPQPPTPRASRLKRYSMPIAVAITATLILTVSFSVFSSSLISNPSILPIMPISTATHDNQLWKFTPNGSVYDTPVVLGNYIYVQSYSSQSTVRNIYCLNSSSGAEVWNNTSDSIAIINGNNVYIKSTFTQNSVTTNIVYALDALTGVPKWNYTSTNGMTPRVATDGVVYLSTGDINEGFFVFALDASTGSELWNYHVPEYIESIDVANGYAFVSFTNVTLHGDMTGYIVALDAVSGAKIWNYTVQGASVNGLDVDRLLYVGTGGSNLYVLDPSNGQKLGNFSTQAFGAVPVAYGNFVYARAENNIYALDASTLSEKWSLNFQESIGAIVPNSPNIIFSVATVIHSVDASSGQSSWIFDVKQNAIYSVSGNRAYVASFYPINFTSPYLVPSVNSNIYELDAATGSKLVTYSIEGNAMNLDAVGNKLYVGTAFATTNSQIAEGNGALYAFEVPESAPSATPTSFNLSTTHLVLIGVLVAAIVAALAGVLFLKKRLSQSRR